MNMGKGSIRTRQEACYYLGVREDSSIDEIKKAYHTLAKMYHPDINPRADVKDYYIKVCESYEYLMQYPVYCTQANNSNMYSIDKEIRCSVVKDFSIKCAGQGAIS